MLTKGFDHLGRPLPLSLSADEQGIGDRKRRPRMRLRIARLVPAIGKIGRSLSGRAISLTLTVLKSSMNSSSAAVAASRARGLVSRYLILARAVISSRVLDVSILVATATAIGVTILSMGNPLALLAEVKSAPQPGADQSTPIILTSAMLSTADAEALPPTAKGASTHEIAAASELACQTQTENSEPSEALFRQFWPSMALSLPCLLLDDFKPSCLQFLQDAFRQVGALIGLDPTRTPPIGVVVSGIRAEGGPDSGFDCIGGIDLHKRLQRVLNQLHG